MKTRKLGIYQILRGETSNRKKEQSSGCSFFYTKNLYLRNKTGKMEADMEKLKFIFGIIQILISIWLLYQSGRIVLRKTKIESSYENMMLQATVAFLVCFAISFNVGIPSMILILSISCFSNIYIIYKVNLMEQKKSIKCLCFALVIGTIVLDIIYMISFF